MTSAPILVMKTARVLIQFATYSLIHFLRRANSGDAPTGKAPNEALRQRAAQASVARRGYGVENSGEKVIHRAGPIARSTLQAYHALSHVEIFDRGKPCRIEDLENGGDPASHTPAHNVPAVAASFRI